MFKYEPNRDADLAVANLWTKMERDGDLPGLFCRSHQTLSGLLRIFHEPNGVLMEADEAHGVWFAMWFEQLMGTVFVGLWVAREMRQTRRALHAILDGYGNALAIYPALMGVTKQERLLAPHVRLGYSVVAKVPGLWDGEPAWLVMLTRPALAATLARYGRRHTAFDTVWGREVAGVPVSLEEEEVMLRG